MLSMIVRAPCSLAIDPTAQVRQCHDGIAGTLEQHELGIRPDRFLELSWVTLIYLGDFDPKSG